MKRLFVVFILVIACLQVNSQAVTPPVIHISSEIEVINGNKYYIHKVESGNTLYSIAKAYGVNSVDIIKLNPDAEFGIKLGQLLKIPFLNGVLTSEKINDNKVNEEYSYHIVKDNETLNSIGKIYDVTEKQILTLNPSIKGAISKGTLLKIPILHENEVDFTSITRTVRSEVVGNPDNIRRKAFVDTLIKFIPKDIMFDKDESISIALFIPFKFDQVNQSVADIVDGAIRKTIDIEGLKYLSIYEGMMVAIDELASNGLKVRFSVYDAGKDLTATKNLLKDTDLLRTDLIFSYTYYETFKIIEEFAQTHNIPIVNALSARKDIVKENPLVFKVHPNSDYVTKSLAEYIASDLYNSRIVIVKNTALEGDELATNLNNSLISTGYSPISKSVVFTREMMEEVNKLPDLIHKDTYKDSISSVKNIVILLGDSEVFVMNALRNLSKAKSKGSIIFGLPTWNMERQNSIAATDINYITNMNIRFISDRSIDKESIDTEKFINDFEELYGMYPEDGAMQSYDLTMFFAAAITEYKEDFYKIVPTLRYDGIYSGYHFINVNGGGYENVFWNIYKYTDYSVDNLNRNN